MINIEYDKHLFKESIDVLLKPDFIVLDKNISKNWASIILLKHDMKTKGHFGRAAVCNIIEKRDNLLLSIQFLNTPLYFWKFNLFYRYDKKIEELISKHFQDHISNIISIKEE